MYGYLFCCYVHTNIIMKNLIRTDSKGETIEVSLAVYITKQGKHYVSYCPALDLSSFGATKKDAQNGFEEAVQLFLEETQERNTLEKVLLDLGWSLKKIPNPEYIPPADLPYPSGPNSTKIQEKVNIPVC